MEKPHYPRSIIAENEFWKYKQQLIEDILQIDLFEKNDFSEFLKKKGYFEFVYGDLGICGGAFSLADKARNRLVYIRNKDLQKGLVQENTDFPFIEIPHYFFLEDEAEAKKYKSLIDAMFIGTRGEQTLIHESKPSPEFYSNLRHLKSEKEASELLPFEIELTNRNLNVIYCTVGEVLFNLYAWRLLFRLIQTKGITQNIKIQTLLNDDYKFKNHYDFWEVITSQKESPESDWIKALRYVYSENTSVRTGWDELHKAIDITPLTNDKPYNFYNEYKVLGLVVEKKVVVEAATKADESPSETKLIVTKEFLSFIRYTIHVAKKLGWKVNNQDIDYDSESPGEGIKQKRRSKDGILHSLYVIERRLDAYFEDEETPFEGFIPFLEILEKRYEIHYCLKTIIIEKLLESIQEENRTDVPLESLLNELHKNSRFPILPYFYELAFGNYHHPKEHMAICIYNSSENKIKIKKANEVINEPGIGFILLTILPIWRICPKSNLMKNGKSTRVMKELSVESYTRFFRIKDFFSFLAQPLVEKIFYGRIIKEQIQKDYYRTDINAFSHEMSKIIDTVFESSNISLESFFTEDIDTVLSLITPYVPGAENGGIAQMKKWKIIPNVERFKIGSNMLKVWAGRRGNLIFEIDEDALISEVLSNCEEMSRELYVGSLFIRFGKIRTLEKLKKYNSKFATRLKKEEQTKKMYVAYKDATLKKIRFKPLAGNDQDDKMITRQNALLRVFLASMTNIYEHTKGDFILYIGYKADKANVLEFSFLNPCDHHKESVIPKSRGTKPVLNSCLVMIDGELSHFGLLKESGKARFDFDNLIKQLKLKSTKQQFWLTRFEFSIDHIFKLNLIS